MSQHVTRSHQIREVQIRQHHMVAKGTDNAQDAKTGDLGTSSNVGHISDCAQRGVKMQRKPINMRRHDLRSSLSTCLRLGSSINCRRAGERGPQSNGTAPVSCPPDLLSIQVLCSSVDALIHLKHSRRIGFMFDYP